MDDIRWSRALLNGVFAWLLSLAIAVVPGVLYIFVAAPTLGRQAQDPLAFGREISQGVAQLYADNRALIVGLVVIAAVVILWRGRAVANGTWHRRWINGLLVGVVPAVLSLSTAVCGGLGVLDAVTAGLYLLAGLFGGLLARP